MIWQLIKRDPAWKKTPYFAAGSAVVWGFGSSDPSAALATISGVTAMMLCVSYRGFLQRYTLLQATLPIEGKDLFLSRIVSLMAFIWTPILAALAATAGRSNWSWTDRLTVVALGAMLTLGLMLIQSLRVRALEPPGWLTILVLVVMVASGPVAGLLLPGSSALLIALLGSCALASAALFLKGLVEVPRSFQLAPVHLKGGQPVSVRSERTGSSIQTAPWWPVFRALYFGSWRTGGGPFIVFVGLFSSVVFGWMSPFLWLTVIPASFFNYRNGLLWLAHLPISARKLFWLVWAPSTAAILLALTLNFALGGLVRPREAAVMLRHGPSWGRLSNVDESGTPNVRVPAGFWRWVRVGSVPVIEAPWGERAQPETSERWGLALYSPYSVGRENSQRFLEWQFLRATQAVYEQPIPIARMDELARMKSILEQPQAQIVAAALVLFYFLIQICALYLSGWKRIRYRRPGFRFLLAVAPMLAANFILTAPFPYFGGGYFLIEWLVLHLTRALPGNLWTLALMAMAPIAVLYWLAERLLRENEHGLVEAMWRPSA
jgi:hypothetical protein